MNHQYKVIFNRRLGIVQVSSENTTGQGKGRTRSTLRTAVAGVMLAFGAAATTAGAANLLVGPGGNGQAPNGALGGGGGGGIGGGGGGGCGWCGGIADRWGGTGGGLGFGTTDILGGTPGYNINSNNGGGGGGALGGAGGSSGQQTSLGTAAGGTHLGGSYSGDGNPRGTGGGSVVEGIGEVTLYDASGAVTQTYTSATNTDISGQAPGAGAGSTIATSGTYALRMNTNQTYDFAGVGGGGGGGTGSRGVDGHLTIDGATLTINRSLLLGGAAGGSPGSAYGGGAGANGTLVLENGAALNVAETLKIGGDRSDTCCQIGGTGTLTINNGTVTVNALDLRATGFNVIQNSGATINLGRGSLNVTGGGPLTLTAYDALNIGGATPNAGVGGSLTGISDIVNNGTLNFHQYDAAAPAYIFAHDISGSGTVTQNNAGTTILTGNNAYTGTTTITSGTLQIGNGGTTGSLGTGAVTNNGTLSFNRSDAVTLDHAISGTGSLAKNGASSLTLTGVNSYSGATVINNGALNLLNAGQLSALSAVQLNNGSFSIAGADGDRQIGALAGVAGTQVNLGANTLIFGDSSQTTFAGTFDGTGGLQKMGSGTTVLNGNNANSGATAIQAGVLQVGAGGATGALGSGNITVASGAGLMYQRSGDFVVANNISGAGTLTKDQAGAMILTGNVSSQLDVTAGTVRIGNLGTAGALNANAVLGAGAGLVFNRTDNTTYAHVVSGNGVLTKNGAGTLTLTNGQTYAGGTQIAGGVLALSGTGSLLSTGALNLSNGGKFSIAAASGARTVGALAGTAGTAVELGANTLTFGDSTAQVFAGDFLSGTGNLIKAGSGVAILMGNNNLTGTLTIQSGAVQIGTNGTSGTLGSGNVVNHGTLAFARADNTLVANHISGNGHLDKFYGGTLTLTGANSYAGNTRIWAGTLQVGNGGNSGSLGAGEIENSGVLAYNRSDTVTLNNIISGTGAFHQMGTGRVILTGNNSYGATTIQSGVLQVGNGGTTGSLGTGPVVNDGSLEFNRAGTMQLSASISGNGSVVQAGAGSLNLTGAHTYTGGTMVNAGRLAVNGSIVGQTTVNPAGTLGGNGTLGSITVAGGAIAPGNSIGALTLTGDLTMQAGSRYHVEVDAAGGHDKITVAGAAMLAGRMDVDPAAGSYAPETLYTVLSAGSIHGSFSDATSRLAFLTPTLRTQGSDLVLQLRRNDLEYAAVAQSPNQRAVGLAVEHVARTPGSDMSLPYAINGLTASQARSAYDTLGGAGLLAAQRVTHGFAGNMISQLRARLGGAGVADSPRAAMNMPVLLASNDVPGGVTTDAGPARFSLDNGIPSAPARRGLWLRGFGSNIDTESDGNAPGDRVRTAGLSVGYDMKLAEGLVAGVAYTHGSSNISMDASETGQSDGKTNGNALAAYASYVQGAWRFNGSAGVVHSSNDMKRRITFSALDRTAHSRFDSNTLFASAEAALDVPTGGWVLQPLLGLSVSRTKTDGFNETGADFMNLSVDRQTWNSARSLLGLRGNIESGKVLWQPRAVWAHEFADRRPTMTSRMPGTPAFSVAGVDVPRDALIAGLTVSTTATRHVSLFADVQGEFNGRQNGIGAQVGLRASW